MPRYRDRSFRSWLFTIAHNAIADSYRSQRADTPLAAATHLADATPTPVTADGLPAFHAFLWEDGTMTDLGTLPGGVASDAIDVNEARQVVGTTIMATGEEHAYVWDDGVMTDLGTLGGADAEAIRINNAGQVVDLSTTAPGQVIGEAGTHAFLWDDGTMTDLGTLGGDFSRANGINDAGQIVGAADTVAGETHPFLWENGTMTDLGLLAEFAGGRAIRINERRLVVGWTQDAIDAPEAGTGPVVRGFVYADGAMTDVGTLGEFDSRAPGVNDAGQVVGASTTAPGQELRGPGTHAFLWEDGAMTDLNALIPAETGGELRGTNSINNLGQIVVTGTLDGAPRACLLTPAGGAGTPVADGSPA